MEKNFGQYQLKELLFESTLIAVWRVQAPESNESVILKLAKKPDLQLQAQLKKEFQLLKRLHEQMPGIIQPLSEGQLDGKYGLTLEDTHQQTLREYLNHQPLPLEKFFSIAIRLTDILINLHAIGIIHKDINPDNILINLDTSKITLIDFSISTELPREEQALLPPILLEGTLAYLSPEQTGRINRAVDHRSDLYSLGVTFYQMLTGQLPFTEQDPLSMVHAHMTKMPPSPHAVNPQIPLILSDIVLTLMAKEVTERYQNTHTLQRDLSRCWEQWQKFSAIDTFSIKQLDVPPQLMLPQKLYGRETFLQTLLTSYEHITQGGIGITLVTGDPGVGKTALIQEMRYQLVNRPHFFISGKFDQYKRDYALSALSAALDDFVQQLMTLPQEDYQQWVECIKKSLGNNGKVLTDLVPLLIKIIGEQPPLIELEPDKAFNRLIFTLQKFINVIATAEHPLVIFLDDLQWADNVTLKWLTEIVAPSFIHTNHLMILGAYRQSEVDAAHPLLKTFQAMEKFIPLHRIYLTPLQENAVQTWLADALYASVTETLPLAELIYKKTEGNPFYMTTLLYNLYRDRLVDFNYQTGKWHWDLAAIQKQNITANVVEFMLQRLTQLPTSSQKLLQYAACMGIQFSLADLAIIAQQRPDHIATELWPALEKGIIVPLSNAYRIVTAQSDMAIYSDFAVKYHFAHDHVQQAAYHLLPAAERAQTHYQIARLLWQQYDEKNRQENIIEIVNHYNAGRSLLNAEENLFVAQLNFQAAERALATANYTEGEHYSAISQDLLTTLNNPWEKHHNLMFNSLKIAAQCSYANGNYQTTQLQIKNLLEHAITAEETLSIYHLDILQYTMQGKFEEAGNALITGLKAVGMDLPRHPTLLQMLKYSLQFWRHFRDINIPSLIERPVANNPTDELRNKLIQAGGPALYETNNLYLISILVFATLMRMEQSGITPTAIMPCLASNILFRGILRRFTYAAQWDQFGFQLLERYPNSTNYPAGLAFYSLTSFRFQQDYSLPKQQELFAKALEAAQQYGDKEIILESARDAYLSFNPHEQAEYFKNLLPLMKAQHHSSLTLRYLGTYSKVLNEINQTNAPDTLSWEEFDEASCITQWEKEKNFVQLVSLTAQKTAIYIRERNYAEAFKYFLKFRKHSLLGHFYNEGAHFVIVKILPLLQGFTHFTLQQKIIVWRYLRHQFLWIKKFAAYNPTLGLPWQHLMEAAFAQITCRTKTAAIYFEKALTEITHNYQTQKCDLLVFTDSLEIAATFYLSINRKHDAAYYLEKAFNLYQQYGYIRRLELMQQRYSDLLPLTQVTHETTHTNIDLETLLRAARTISSEIDLNPLLQKLLRLIIENGGASFGALILKMQSEWHIKAIGTTSEIELLDVPLTALANSSLPLSSAIIEIVIRQQKMLLLNYANKEGAFTQDRHIQQNEVKSIICLPLTKQNQLVGILYLENQAIYHAFTENHIEILNTLSAQAAISIENALLYTNIIQLNTAYEKFVPQEFLNLLEKNSILDIHLGDQVQRNMTVLFTDIRNFTVRSEAMDPAENFRFINDYLSEMEPLIRQHQGFIDKYIGDAIMALFPTQASEALSAALALLRQLNILNQRYPDNPIRIGIGLNTGPLILGIVGGQQRLQGTVISDAVNLASRVETLNKQFATDCLVTESTVKALPDHHDFKFRRIGYVKVKGKSQPTHVYELLNHQPEAIQTSKLIHAVEFDQALAVYETGNIAQAKILFTKLLQKSPDDQVVQTYIHLCGSS